MAAKGLPEHPLLIVNTVNAVLGPVVRTAGEAVGYQFAKPDHPIPAHIVMIMLITAVVAGVGLFIRSRLSVENPGKFQIVIEDLILAVRGILE